MYIWRWSDTPMTFRDIHFHVKKVVKTDTVDRGMTNSKTCNVVIPI